MAHRSGLALGALAVVAMTIGCAASMEQTETAAQSPLPQTSTATDQSARSPASPTVPQTAEKIPEKPPEFSYRQLFLVRKSRNEGPRLFTVNEDDLPAEPTKILDSKMAERLFGNTGITLQWIGWEERGKTFVAVSEEGYWVLLGEQKGQDGGVLDIEGFITEIGSDYFLYDGTIKIAGAPSDRTQGCNTTKQGWRFAITQDRKYWRLREFEWCDELTDYVDIYF